MRPRLHRVRDEAPGENLAKARKNAGERKMPFARHKALRQLDRRAARIYDAVVDKLYKEILRFVATEIVPGAKLRKSDDETAMYGFASAVDWPDDEMVGMASADDTRRRAAEKKLSLLTPAQLETLKRIVQDYHLAFALGVYGPDSIPPAETARLISMGIVPEDLALVFTPRPGEEAPLAMRLTDLAYQYGQQLGDARQRDAVTKMGADEFLEHLEATRAELSPVDRQAMAWARYNAGQHVRGMGDRISLQLGTVVLDADAEQRRKYLGVIQRELEESIDKRATWRELASEIGHATEDWSRDMQRVAATETQFAMQEAQAREIAKHADDPDDVRVAKIPAPDACPDCVRLHLTAGPGSPPRIFKLSELQANGTNVGRKRAAWKAVVGPVHPWCGCELVEVPGGWGFDEDGNMVPEIMLKKGDRLDVAEDVLRKGEREHMTYRGAVPDVGLTIRVGDPRARAVVEAVVKEAPPEIFRRDVGVTLITTDIPRVQNPLEEHDFAYWTANEIRISQTLPIERWPRVLRHELGHSLNVYLMRQLGGAGPVRAWHDRLWAISEEEGFVSDYARKLPIENAAEATRMYLFERPKLMLNYPRTFAFLHRYYRGIFEATA